jgi:hypothetical protein
MTMTYTEVLDRIEKSAELQGLQVRRLTPRIHPFAGVSYVVETERLDDPFNVTEHVVRLLGDLYVTWS